MDIQEAITLRVEHPEGASAQQARVAELVESTRTAEAVSSAAVALHATQERIERFTLARNSLAARGKDLNERICIADACLSRALIEHHSGNETDVSDLVQRRLFVKTEYDGIGLALSQVVEILIPAAEVELLSREAAFLDAEAGELERLAGERAEEMTRLLSAAVELQGVIEVHTPSTISGLLLAEARFRGEQAARLRTQAYQSERQWADILKQAAKLTERLKGDQV